MAMNKKEKEEVEALRWELAKTQALRFPSYPMPERMDRDELTPPDGGYGKQVVIAWTQNNHNCEYRVEQGCSNGVTHCRYSTEKTSTQGCGMFYRTKLDALQAARIEMTERFAAALARIDAEIIKERQR